MTLQKLIENGPVYVPFGMLAHAPELGIGDKSDPAQIEHRSPSLRPLTNLSEEHVRKINARMASL